MSDLSQLQNDFQNYLLQKNSAIDDFIIDTENLSGLQRLDIYRDAYSARLFEVLGLEYPVVHDLLGHEEFHLLGQIYLAANPSVFKSVRWFGNRLPDFIATANLYQANPLILAMAHFENLLSEVFDEANSKVIALEEMAAIPFEDWAMMRFELIAAFRRLDTHWNLVPIWNAIKENETPTIQKLDQPIHLVIWRHQLEVQFCSLTEDELFTIDAMQAGKTFGEICEGLCEWVEAEDVAMHAATLLKRFILDEIIAEIHWRD